MGIIFKIAVLAKQVPDTRQIAKDSMNPDGTINRAALSAIFNPDDLKALEQALIIKDLYPDSTITIITMGPDRAKEIVLEAFFRGADRGFLLSDRLFAGADTLATSYALSTAIKKIGEFDIIICGCQAIDGDTAQVGPQVAEKLGLPQITYCEKIESIEKSCIRIKRYIKGGFEIVESPLPALITVSGSAKTCRPRNIRLLIANKNREVPIINVADINADPKKCGLSGSPTKVKSICNIVFQAKESCHYENTDDGIESLVEQLISNHTIE